MPVEAVHQSALVDSLSKASGWVRRQVAGPYQDATRLGAMFVDLPYFDRFALAVVRYALRRPQGYSHFGELFHQKTPITLGRLLGEAGQRLSQKSATAEAGKTLMALALGYISHAAVDTSMHPHINDLARQRAARSGLHPSQEHHEIEKYHSLIFHEQRFSADLMGTEKLQRYIEVDGRMLGDHGPIGDAVQAALGAVHGQGPSRADLRRYARGYLQYCSLIGNRVVGPQIGPRKQREAARAEVYDAFDFPGRFSAAVDKSLAYLDALGAYLADGVFDESAQAALARVVPEGSIDPFPTT